MPDLAALTEFEDFNRLPPDIRTDYYVLFDNIVHLYNLHHMDAPISIDIDDKEQYLFDIREMEDLTVTMHKENIIDDYMNASLNELYELFPTLIGEAALYDHDIKDKEEIKELKRFKELVEYVTNELIQIMLEVSDNDRVRYEKEFAKRHE